MIRPDALFRAPGLPRNVEAAYQAFDTQVAVNSFWRTVAGYEFLRELFIKGGTEEDFAWLISKGVLEEEDRIEWERIRSSFPETDLDNLGEEG